MNREIIKNNSFEPMGCREVGSYLPLFVLGGQGMTTDECRAVKHHLQACSRCSKAYKETDLVINMLQSQRKYFIERGLFSGLEPAEIDKEPTVEESFEELQDKLQRTRVRARRNRRNSKLKVVLKRSAAVAACLVIGVLTWMIFSNYSEQEPLAQKTASQQIVSLLEPSVTVELVEPSGNIAIGTDHPIVADKEIKKLLINGKHQMIINVGTILSIEPMVKQSNIGCLVKLDSGQIYTHVQNDGNPFTVDTANGHAVITGTTFDIKATKSSTTLVVTEGTVRFESQEGTVNVVAGQKSKIVGQSAPLIPLTCNTYELTAWATGYKPNTVLAQNKPNDIDLYLELPLRTDPIVLANIDYDYWVNEKRNWFKANFPWIFELKDALAMEIIEVDYPELLIRSDDVWQFVCLQRFPGRFSVPNFKSLLKIATFYGFDKEWLLENVPIAKLIQNKSLLSEHPTGLDALDQLLKYLKGTETMPYYLYPADAGRYLTETRSLVWFAVNAGQFKLIDKQRNEVLDLLQQEVIAATNCSNDLLYPEDKNKKSHCGEDLCKTLEKKVIENIEIIKNIEIIIKDYWP